jgi:hypothetical protein
MDAWDLPVAATTDVAGFTLADYPVGRDFYDYDLSVVYLLLILKA